MTKTITILTVFTLLFSACNQSKDKTLTNDRQNNLDSVNINLKTLTGYWTLTCFSDLDKNTNEFDSSSKIWLWFSDEKLGIILGRSRCNHLNGKYKIYDNNKIKVKDFMGTKVYCSEKWDDRLRRTMRLSSSFKYNTDTLLILYDNDKKAMKFIKTKND
jgi:heat shock protein HslJ